MPNLVNKSRTYEGPFAVHPENLARICGILDSAFARIGPDASREIAVSHADGTKADFEDLNNVLSMDNTERNPVVGASIQYIAREEHVGSSSALIRFSSGYRTPEVHLIVNSPRQDWCQQVFAELEEQLERTSLRSWVYRIKAYTNAFSLAVNLMLAISVVVPIMALAVLLNSQALSAKEAQRALSQFPADRDPAKATLWMADIQKRQLEAKVPTPTSPLIANLSLLRAASILVPLAIVAGVLWYLLRYCYPAASFAWGDMKQKAEELRVRRQHLWTTVIGALVLGVLGNFFVLGVAG